MATVHDVAAFILNELGPMSAMKLQKLAYYSQAWSLVWDDAELFPEEIQAWANGPVVRDLYDHHRGEFEVSKWPMGDVNQLTDKQKETVRAVLSFYGSHTAHWLSQLSHMEAPWKKAREGLKAGERSWTPISTESMAEYYEGITLE
jgi:uncharacterized phage-associated protein